MSYFLLPRLNNQLQHKIQIQTQQGQINPPLVSETLYCYMMQSLSRRFREQEEFKFALPYVFPYYELFKTHSSIYYMIHELHTMVQVFDGLRPNATIGCFTESINDTYYACKSVIKMPFRFHSLLHETDEDLHTQIHRQPSEHFIDRVESIFRCDDTMRSSMDCIITRITDSFIDKYTQHNYSKRDIWLLYFAYCLFLQKQGGSLIMNIDETCTQLSVDVLYILSSLYERVYIIKPNSSEPHDTEKIIVCKQFKNVQVPFFFMNYCLETLNVIQNKPFGYTVSRLLNITEPLYFTSRLEECNAIMGQLFLDTYMTIRYVYVNRNRQERLTLLARKNTQRLTYWLLQNNVKQINEPSNIRNGVACDTNDMILDGLVTGVVTEDVTEDVTGDIDELLTSDNVYTADEIGRVGRFQSNSYDECKSYKSKLVISRSLPDDRTPLDDLNHAKNMKNMKNKHKNPEKKIIGILQRPSQTTESGK